MMYLLHCNWVDTWWQQYSTHLHTNSTQMTQNKQYIEYLCMLLEYILVSLCYMQFTSLILHRVDLQDV